MRTALTALLLALPAAANEANISCGDPTRTGLLRVEVTVVNAHGKKEVVKWTASVPSSADEEQKAKDIRSAAPTGSPYVTIGGAGSAVRATSKPGWTITRMSMNTDTTGEKATPNVFAAGTHDGVFSLSGTASGFREDGLPAQVSVEVNGAFVVYPIAPGQHADELEDLIVADLVGQGVSARLATPEDLLELRYGLVDDGRSIVIEDVAAPGMSTDCDDTGLDVDVTGLVDPEFVTSIGENYCVAEPTSTGGPASITALGSPFVADQSLVLRAYDLPPNQFGYFLVSRDEGFVPQPPGSVGNLCLGGQIGRFSNQVQSSGPSGELEILVDPLVMPTSPPTAILPGEVWRYQCWFRDIDVAPTSNFTDGIWIEWQ